MRLYLFIVFYLIVIYIFPCQKSYSSNEEYYINLLKYGTDLDIVSAFTRVNDDLGEKVNKNVLLIFEEKHSEKVYHIIVKYIGTVELKSSGKTLLAELQKENAGEDYREELINTVGLLKISESIDLLKDIYGEKRTTKRLKLAIINAYGKIGDRSIEDTLIEIVLNEEEDVDIKARAILNLGELGTDKSKDLLTEILLNTYEEKILRMYSATSLSKIGKESVLDTLAAVIDDQSHEVAEYAVNGIAEIGSNKAGDILVEALRSDYDKVRYYAVVGLSKMKFKKAEDILKFKAEYDSNESVRKEAKKALENITNQKQEDSVENEQNL
jgi:hypothetical protein